MMMHELMEQLHGVEAGAFDFERELAGEAAGAIEILQTKLNRYKELKQKGLERSKEFTLERMVEKSCEVYRKL